MWRKLAGALLLTALLANVDVSGPPKPAEAAGAPAPPASGAILYVQGPDLWSMSAADGSNKTQLTHETNGNFANGGVFSPDGSKIAYAAHTAGLRPPIGAAPRSTS